MRSYTRGALNTGISTSNEILCFTEFLIDSELYRVDEKDGKCSTLDALHTQCRWCGKGYLLTNEFNVSNEDILTHGRTKRITSADGR